MERGLSDVTVALGWAKEKTNGRGGENDVLSQV